MVKVNIVKSKSGKSKSKIESYFREFLPNALKEIKSVIENELNKQLSDDEFLQVLNEFLTQYPIDIQLEEFENVTKQKFDRPLIITKYSNGKLTGYHHTALKAISVLENLGLKLPIRINIHKKEDGKIWMRIFRPIQ